MAFIDILPDRLFNLKKPMKHAIKLAELKLSELYRVDDPNVNPFEILFNNKVQLAKLKLAG